MSLSVLREEKDATLLLNGEESDEKKQERGKKVLEERDRERATPIEKGEL